MKPSCLVILSRYTVACKRCLQEISNLKKQFDISVVLDGGNNPRGPEYKENCTECGPMSKEMSENQFHTLREYLTMLANHAKSELDISVDLPYFNIGNQICYMRGIDIAKTLIDNFDHAYYYAPRGIANSLDGLNICVKEQ